MNNFADTHCHLNFDIFKDDLTTVLDRAENRGINRILVPGFDLNSSILAVEYSARYPMVFAAVGVHPNEVDTWDASRISVLENLCTQPKVVAIGEIGLDFYRNPSTSQAQEGILRQQLDLAVRQNLPVLIHNRNSTDRLLEILKDYRLKGIFHAYAGDRQVLDYAAQKGYFLGIGGSVTYPKSKLDEKLLHQIWQNCVFETDSPFLSPNPVRGKRNEPSNIQIITEYSAKILHVSIENLSQTTSRNTNALFNWY